jgi:hypothetical protein
LETPPPPTQSNQPIKRRKTIHERIEQESKQGWIEQIVPVAAAEKTTNGRREHGHGLTLGWEAAAKLVDWAANVRDAVAGGLGRKAPLAWA